MWRVAQAQSVAVKDGVADLLWKNSVLLNTGGKVGGTMARIGACTPC